jgi:hypothetical protein
MSNLSVYGILDTREVNAQDVFTSVHLSTIHAQLSPTD